jgi:2-dehydropantoate 2-reductase
VTQPFKSIVVVGSGAVGSFYGAMLARAGHHVTLIGRAPHVQAIELHGLQLHMAGRVEAIKIGATTKLDVVRGADLVLFCVKSLDTDAVAHQIAPLLDANAIVLSLQNGVDNARVLTQHLNQHSTQLVVPIAVYVATAMPEAGVVQHFGRGDLVIGNIHISTKSAATEKRLQTVVALFATAQVPVRISPDVMGELWGKLLVNCAYNAISAVAQMPYGKMAALPAIVETQHAVVREVIAVALADGQKLLLSESLQAVERIAIGMPEQLSSTAQDIARGKPTEIDHLNGFIARRGAELGVATPVNQALFALVKLLEVGRVTAKASQA